MHLFIGFPQWFGSLLFASEIGKKEPMRTYSFEKLEVWQLARAWRKNIYAATCHFPDSEKYGLTSQLRRAANSITANLAEGCARSGTKDRLKFVNIAYASTIEVLDHLITAHDLRFIDDPLYHTLRLEMDTLVIKLERFTAFLNKSVPSQP